jgi:hypothetical protein
MPAKDDQQVAIEEEVQIEEALTNSSSEPSVQESEGALEEGTDDTFSVSIGEEEPEPNPHVPAPAWVKEMRKENRELKRQLRQVQRAATAQPPIELGEKPTLEKLDYDTNRYEEELAAWYVKKLKIDEQAAQIKEQEKAQARSWQEKLGAYERAKLTLGAEDFEDAEAVILSNFDVAQQSIIISGAKDAALLVYALGKNPTKAKTLAAIKDPVQFAFAAAHLEAQLKVSDKKPATLPETRVSGNGRVSGGTDATLERLRSEAERTGDYTKVIAYKRNKQNRS